jgi:4-hydroxy-tetrahydrodipicolinate reductase
MNTAHELAKVRPSTPPAVPSRELAAGARGGEVEGICVHSLWLPGPPGIEEVRLARTGELLTISLAAYDRVPFALGAILAIIKSIGSRPGLTYGLVPLLELDGD